MFSIAPSRERPGGATYTFTPVRKMYCSEFPFAEERCGTSSTKKMSQHSLVNAAPGRRERRTIRVPCGSTRTDRGETPSIGPHEVPVDPAATNRLSPFSTRSQSERGIGACTTLSDGFPNEKLGANPFVPAANNVASTRTTSHRRDADCQTHTPMKTPRARKGSR